MPLKTATQQISRVSRPRLYEQPVEQLMDFIEIVDNALDVTAPAMLEHIDLVSDRALKQS